jgi:hypothetical protein
MFFFRRQAEPVSTPLIPAKCPGEETAERLLCM